MDFEKTEYLELNTFIVRISPCDVTSSPDNLILRFITQQTSEYLEINGNQPPYFEPTCLTLQKECVDIEKSEVVYVNKDKVKVNHLGGHCSVDDGDDVGLAAVDVGRFECEGADKRDLVMERDETSGCVIKMYPLGPCPEFIRSKVDSQPSMEVELLGFCSDIPVKLKMSTRLDTDYFQFRLFYVRISCCDIDKVPNNLTLRYTTYEPWEYFEVNGNKYPDCGSHSVTLHRAHIDLERSEVVYISTDNVIISYYGVNCDIIDNENQMKIAMGDVGRWRYDWTKRNVGLETDVRTGYAVQLYPEVLPNFVKRNLGVSKPFIEVYVAGCCSTLPVAMSVIKQFDWSAADASHLLSPLMFFFPHLLILQ